MGTVAKVHTVQLPVSTKFHITWLFISSIQELEQGHTSTLSLFATFTPSNKREHLPVHPFCLHVHPPLLTCTPPWET